MMLASANKTDRLDARGMNRLQRTGTLPTVWIPSAELRDQRELFRTRMVFTQQRTRVKNRIHATLAKYALRIEECSDVFSKKGREELTLCLAKLPPHTRYAAERLLEQLDSATVKIAALEAKMREVFAPNSAIKYLMSLPGVGFILAVVIFSEVGEMGRFGSPSRFASYSGTAPRVHASGGKIRLGRLRSDANRYLKWAFAEPANVNAVNHRR
jgi:transposase